MDKRGRNKKLIDRPHKSPFISYVNALKKNNHVLTLYESFLKSFEGYRFSKKCNKRDRFPIWGLHECVVQFVSNWFRKASITVIGEFNLYHVFWSSMYNLIKTPTYSLSFRYLNSKFNYPSLNTQTTVKFEHWLHETDIRAVVSRSGVGGGGGGSRPWFSYKVECHGGNFDDLE